MGQMDLMSYFFVISPITRGELLGALRFRERAGAPSQTSPVPTPFKCKNQPPTNAVKYKQLSKLLKFLLQRMMINNKSSVHTDRYLERSIALVHIPRICGTYSHSTSDRI